MLKRDDVLTIRSRAVAGREGRGRVPCPAGASKMVTYAARDARGGGGTWPSSNTHPLARTDGGGIVRKGEKLPGGAGGHPSP